MTLPTPLVWWDLETAYISGAGTLSTLANRGSDVGRSARLYDLGAGAAVDITPNLINSGTGGDTGKALATGANDYYLTNELTTGAWGRTDTVFTIAMYVRMPANGGQPKGMLTCRSAITFTTASGSRGWMLYQNPDHATFSFQTMNSSGVISTKVSSTSIGGGGVWGTVIVRVNGATVDFVINGTPSASTGASVTPTYSAGKLWQGEAVGLDPFGNGATADIRYWDVLLSDAEALEYHNDVTATSTPPVLPTRVVWWDFEPTHLTGSGTSSRMVNQGSEANQDAFLYESNLINNYVDWATYLTAAGTGGDTGYGLPVTDFMQYQADFANLWPRADTTFTIGVYLKTPAATNARKRSPVMSRLDAANSGKQGWSLLQTASATTFTFETSLANGSIASLVTSSGLTGGTWHTVMVRYSAGVANFVVDGVPISATGAVNVISQSSNVYFGGVVNGGNGYSGYFNGSVADISYWNSSLSDADALQYYTDMTTPVVAPGAKFRSAGSRASRSVQGARNTFNNSFGGCRFNPTRGGR